MAYRQITYVLLALLFLVAPVLASDTEGEIVEELIVEAESEEEVLIEDEVSEEPPEEVVGTEEEEQSAELATPDEVVSAIVRFVQAVKEGNLIMAASLALMLLVWLVRAVLWKRIPAKWVPSATVGLSTLTVVSVGLSTGTPAVELIALALGGALVGLSSIGFWELLGQHLAPSKKDSKEAGTSLEGTPTET